MKTIVKNEILGEEYTLVTHPSGLKVYIYPKKLATTYALFATKYGSLDRTFKKKSEKEFLTVPDGIAHFLEHKLFEEEDGTDVFAKFAKLGANANAYTSFEMTAYLFSTTEEPLKALSTLLEFVTHPYFTPENVLKEQGIIGQEISMYDDHPGSRVYYSLLENLYRDHNVKVNIAGTAKTIAQITPELLYRCYDTFYCLSNMALCICGNVSEEEVMETVNAALQGKDGGEEIERQYPIESSDIVRPYSEQKMSVGQPMFAFGFKDNSAFASPCEKEKHVVSMDILTSLLFAPSTPLYNKLYDDGAFSSFSAEYESMGSCAHYLFIGESRDPKTLYEEIKSFLSDLPAHFPEKEDFERIKRSLYADYIRSFDSTESIATEVITGAFRDVDYLSVGKWMSEITYEDFKEKYIRYFEDKEFSLTVIYPEN